MAVKVPSSFDDAITFILSFHKAENLPIITDLDTTKTFLTWESIRDMYIE
jgi:hypothetical protein